MISYSTEFPIKNNSSTEEVLALACEWISGSPHTKIKEGDLIKIIGSPDGFISSGNETITTGYASLPDYEIGGLRYVRLENDEIEWITTIVASQTPSQHLVSIQVSCEALRATTHLPIPKKPYFVKQIFEKVGGGMDGQIPVSTKPFILSNGEEGIAAELIMGQADNSLPIVYVSSGFDGNYSVNYEKMAQWLSGMAHVIVEPNREFSVKIKELTFSRNVYGGTVGVYWPDSTGRKSYFPAAESDTADRLQTAIYRDIRMAIANRRQKAYCNWLHLKECISKNRYDNLKSSGSTEIEEYIKIFDEDMKAKQEKLDEAEKEIARLQAEFRKFNAGNSSGEEGILIYGKEQDLYANEIKNFVIETLSKCLDNTIDGSRKRHILEDLIEHNMAESDVEKIKEEIKSVFKSYTDMDTRIKNTLTRLGFDISEDGKHYKLVFNRDSRYTFSVSKTSSDHRAGKNLVSDINKKLF